MRWFFIIACFSLFDIVSGQSNLPRQSWSFSFAYSPNITGSIQIHEKKTVLGQNIFLQVEKTFSKSWGIFANAGLMSTHFVYYDYSPSHGFQNLEKHLHFQYAGAFIGPTYHIGSFYVEPGFGLAFLKGAIVSHYTVDENMKKTSNRIKDPKYNGGGSANIGNMLTLGHTTKIKSFKIDIGIRGFMIYDTNIDDIFGLGVFVGLRI